MVVKTLTRHSSAANPVKPVDVTDDVSQEEKMDNFLKEKFHGVAVNQMFSKKELNNLKVVMAERAGKLGGNVDKVFAEMKPYLEEIGEYTSDLQNVNRQNFEIGTPELNPGKVDIIQQAQLMMRDIPIAGMGKPYEVKYNDIPSLPSSVVGGSEAARQRVRKEVNPRIHSGVPVSSPYRNMVKDAQSECIANIAEAQAKLMGKLQYDKEPPKNHLEKIRKSDSKRVASNLAEFTGYEALKGLKWLTRGIIGHTNAAEDSRYYNYLKERDDFVARARFKIDPKSGKGTAYLRALEKMYDKMSTGDGVLSAAEFVDMQKLILDAITAEDAANKTEAEALNTKLAEINEAMLKSMRDVVGKEDTAWKYRVAQIVLLMSPFGFFNYMMPVAHILGPLFSSSLTFGQGLGEVAHNIPIFGELVHAIKLDVAISFVVDNTPIIGDVGNVIHTVIASDSAQNLFGAVSPMVTGSPLVPLAIAAVVSTLRGGSEVDLYNASEKAVKEGDKKLREEVEKFEKSLSDDSHKARVADFAAKEIETNVVRHFLNDLVQFITHAEEKELAIFNSVKFGGLTLLQLKQQAALNPAAATINLSSPAQVMALLFKEGVSKEMRRELLKSFFVYEHIADAGLGEVFKPKEGEKEFDDADRNLAAFAAFSTKPKEDPKSVIAIAEKEFAKRKEDIVIKYAEEVGFQSIFNGDSPAERSKKAAHYEMQIIESRVKTRMNGREILCLPRIEDKAPSKSPVPPFQATPGIPLVNSQSSSV